MSGNDNLDNLFDCFGLYWPMEQYCFGKTTDATNA